jgi:hypothetical protein
VIGVSAPRITHSLACHVTARQDTGSRAIRACM